MYMYMCLGTRYTNCLTIGVFCQSFGKIHTTWTTRNTTVHIITMDLVNKCIAYTIVVKV